MRSLVNHDHRHKLDLGVDIGEVVRPGAAQELGAALAEYTAMSRTVLPFGGGSSVLTGHVVPGFDVGIDTRGLSGVIDYQPADLTLSVGAGTTIADIAAVLAEKGQEIPIDVPFPERTTIGGLAATGFAGPRRLLSGSLKDAIIGCEYVRGDGLVAKAGGLVVKNVSGFEIPRFLHGSWGALAVLTSINLKVSPRPRSEATVQVEWRDVADAVASMHEVALRIPSLAASVIDVGDGRVTSSCRVMGREEAVNATVERIVAVLSADRAVIPSSESRNFWQEHVDAWAPTRNGTQIAIGVRPSEVGGTVSAIQAALAGADHRATLSIAPGLGSIRIRLAAGDEGVPIWPLSRLEDLPERTTGILESGPDPVRKGADPWGPRPEGQALMVEIKRRFDPGNILNRGRLFI